MAIKTMFVDPSRCIGCRSCEAACRECDSHKGESMIMVDFIDRERSVATQPTICMHCTDPVAPCAQVCPTQAIWYGDYEEFDNMRVGHPVNRFQFGTQNVQTRVYYVMPEEETQLDIVALLRETEAGTANLQWQNQEAWVL